MKDKVFDSLQRLGKTFMLPIALLPVAGLMLGIGASFTGDAFVKTYGLEGILGHGTLLFKILTVLKDCGGIVFANLPLLFAVGVALGMAKKVKEVAALSAVVSYLMMYASLTSVIDNILDIEKLREVPGLIGSVLSFSDTMNTGVFGGIIVGAVVAWLTNKYYTIELPASLSFFSGVRFVPIVSAFAGVVLGFVFGFGWPIVAKGIAGLGVLVANLDVFGTFIYGYVYRALIPLGLHHVFYLPFWQTAMGGTAMVDGQLIEGAQNIIFAQIEAGQPVSYEAARFFSGLFPFMICGFPGAALAMYHTAKPERKEDVKGLLLSASLTSILTGITEPIEFSFLFASPLLYFGVHCVLAALSFVIMQILHVAVGVTFSGGIIDFLLYGVLQGQSHTNWIPVVFVGIAYAFIYYFVFLFFIKKFDLKTPGREDDVQESKLYTKKDYLEKKEAGSFDQRSADIVEALGGKDNLVEVDNCATRLRVTVKDGSLANEAALKATGAAGVLIKNQNVQVIYGTMVPGIRLKIDEYLETL
ncbi:PTS system IIB component, Glc family /PTS system IIC component, Glc family [Granulicatella balaenopterae]|uniref:PTS system IIB component, Glc family /PTS system IIC component, Glc family n=1 Tax=Granulicatella balaenopterae TaxID=137733 RepID=A0A1H9PBI7_9LACT|nr:PTS transporter subunit EIIC [Granulicatella balaenopterae]SER45548.1 PTS system IIB component, Glc family /PTS system IIC component, Glc family [Granulicatella balaenopterae]